MDEIVSSDKKDTYNTIQYNTIQYNTIQYNTIQNKTKQNEIRESNFELLRIFCMILIVMFHYASYSGFNFSNDITLNKLIILFLSLGGKIGVNVFVLITGYFMGDKEFKIKKVINLVLQVFTYTFIFLIINICFSKVSLTQVIKSLLPVTYSHYWFITTYIVLYLLSPYINIFIKNASRKELRNLIIILVTIESIIKTFLASEIDGSELIWFITLYLIGTYIKKYYKKQTYSIKIDFLGFFSTYIIIMISAIVLDKLCAKITLFEGRQLFFAQMTSTIALANSIFMFLLFKNINIGKNKIINTIASTVLGIYIIHENNFMRDIIWKNIFKGGEYQNSPWLIINAIIAIMSVFIISSLIEWTRQKTLVPIQNKFVDNVIEKVNKFKSRKSSGNT